MLGPECRYEQLNINKIQTLYSSYLSRKKEQTQISSTKNSEILTYSKTTLNNFLFHKQRFSVQTYQTNYQIIKRYTPKHATLEQILNLFFLVFYKIPNILLSNQNQNM
eukprot:TRINITY_DN1396_c3_g1_i1.p4 TRINITY_DN1396_c3_g1~~TRINITY_DN1396_c3_g1_i1.p4  ORF type:complete len:108 (-),score=0.19 TRINITY_DN1396_c3_g1_i1:417-740(-)